MSRCMTTPVSDIWLETIIGPLQADFLNVSLSMEVFQKSVRWCLDAKLYVARLIRASADGHCVPGLLIKQLGSHLGKVNSTSAAARCHHLAPAAKSVWHHAALGGSSSTSVASPPTHSYFTSFPTLYSSTTSQCMPGHLGRTWASCALVDYLPRTTQSGPRNFETLPVLFYSI